MDYKKRFEEFITELRDLIERHAKERDETEHGEVGKNEIMAVLSDEPAEPVVYPKIKSSRGLNFD